MSYDTSLFVIVEGKVYDPYFVEKICVSSPAIMTCGYEVKLISQISMANGVYASGKDAALAYYDYCRANRKLTQSNSKGTRSIAFFIDRDCQQVTGGMRRSPHVIYTRAADVEAEIFSDAHEVAALAMAASLDMPTAIELKESLGDWRSDLATDWRKWIELCYLAEAVRARSRGFGSPTSRIHTGPRHRTLDPMALAGVEAEIARTTLLPPAEYTKTHTRIMGKINKIYLSGQQAGLLNGKWLPAQLTMAVEDFFEGGADQIDWHKEDFKGSVLRCYEANLNPASTGAIQLRTSFERLLANSN